MKQLQAVLTAFFVLSAVGLIVLVVRYPQIYAPSLHGRSPWLLLAPLLALVTLLIVGILRRWTWVFWTVLVAFILAGIRVPVTLLEFARVLPLERPIWFLLLRTAVSCVQVAIGLWMIELYRRGETRSV